MSSITTSPTTDPKLIPFDLDIALKHPERVRHKRGSLATQIAHFPAAYRYPVVIHWADDQNPCFYTVDGHCTDLSAEASVFLTAETKIVPWETVDEVPEGMYFRNKNATYEMHITNGYSLLENKVLIYGSWVPLKTLHGQWEFSPNRNGPWLPCGKEVAG